MSTTPAASRQNTTAARQPDFWKRYSPHGECPLSVTGSVLLHIPLILLLFFGWLIWGAATDSESSKPPKMDIVEVMPGGGGLGEIGTVGPGKNKTGPAGRAEGVEEGSIPPPPQLDLAKLKDFKLPKFDPKLDLPVPDEIPDIKEEGDPFKAMARQREYAEQLLAKQLYDASAKPGPTAGFKGGVKGGAAGGAGGPAGAGLGADPNAKYLSEQRRHELKWLIMASDDGEVHLKKLRALKVVLMIQLPSQPGYALRYDLSRGGVANAEKVRFVDDTKKVRWQNTSPKEMLALQKVLRLPEVPVCSVIYLPTELEADMARRELSYQGRQEFEIYKTVWDVRERDGVYDNEPYIVRQVTVDEMMRGKGR
jgi:hypothetical protein